MGVDAAAGRRLDPLTRLPTGAHELGIDEGTRAVDCVFGCASLGVYTPRTVRVTCANGAAFRLSPHPEQGVTSAILETPPVEAP